MTSTAGLPTQGRLYSHWTLLLLFSHSVVSSSLWPHELQHARLPCPSLSPRACSNSCPFSQWYHPTISSSVVPCLLLPSVFPSIRGFSHDSALQIRWPKYWSFRFSISPSSEYSGLISFRTGWISLQSKGLSRVFSNTTIRKHQFFSAQSSLWSNSHIHYWALLLNKKSFVPPVMYWFKIFWV